MSEVEKKKDEKIISHPPQTFTLEQVQQLLKQQKTKLKEKVYSEREVRELVALLDPPEPSVGRRSPPINYKIPKRRKNKRKNHSKRDEGESVLREVCKPCISICGIGCAFFRIGCLPIRFSYWVLAFLISKMGLLFSGILVIAFTVAVLSYILGNMSQIVTNANNVYSGVIGQKINGVTWQPIPTVGTMESENDKRRRRRKEKENKEKMRQQKTESQFGGMNMGTGPGTGIDIGKVSKAEERRLENLRRHHERVRDYSRNAQKQYDKQKKRRKRKDTSPHQLYHK